MAATPMILSLALDPALPLADLIDAAELAETVGLDLVICGYPRTGLDPEAAETGPLRADPLCLAGALIGRTHRIGLGAVVRAAAWAPFNAARGFAALDHLSAGRAAWCAVPGEAAEEDPDGSRFREHLQVTCALFESWDEDALVFDKSGAILADRERVRRIAHAGRHFTVDGPLNAPRPPQGRPVMLAPAAAARAGLADLELGGRGLRELPLAAWAGRSGRLADWMLGEAHGCAGFVLMAPDLTELQKFALQTVPALLAEGALGSAAGGKDLRTRLGLRRPARAAAAKVPA